MAAGSRIWRAVTIARQWQPQTYWQVWLHAAGLPLVALIVGAGLRLVFGTWPQFDVHGAIATIGYVAVRVGVGSRALRTRHLAQSIAAPPVSATSAIHDVGNSRLQS